MNESELYETLEQLIELCGFDEVECALDTLRIDLAKEARRMMAASTLNQDTP